MGSDEQIGRPGSARPASERLLAGVIALIALLYAASLNGHLSPGGDNATYILLAKGLLEKHAYCVPNGEECVPHQKFPPLFPLLLAPAIAALGLNVLALKALVAIIAILSLVVLHRLLLPVAGTDRALLVTLLAGISPHLGAYAHDVLSEFPFLALTLGGLLATERY